MIDSIINKYLAFKYKKVEKFIEKPFMTQEKVLKSLLNRGKNTYFGQENSFQNIQNKDDYRNIVPVSNYETLRPYLDKVIVEKQSNILWDKPIKWFAMSSGTTEDRSKYIPVTEESLKFGHYECGHQLLSIYTHHYPQSKFLLGKTLILGGSKQYNQIGHGIYTGDISAILIKNLNFIYKQHRTPESIALLADWEEKLDALTKYALLLDVRALMGVPSWLLILLKKIRNESGKQLKELWPNLEVFFHGGVNFLPYEEQYEKLIGKSDVAYWETYNASEGFFGIQFSKENKDMLLMLDNAIYYEFIPSSEWEAESPKTLTLEEVKPFENYAIVISSNGGLWRYQLGDTIEFTSTNPYLFRITGRTKSFINAFGEELIVDNAEKALEKVCEQMNLSIIEYTAAPVYFDDNQGGAHEWAIEFDKAPYDLSQFIENFDNALKSVNSDYEAKRSHNLSLQAPIVRILPQGTFLAWMESRHKLGGQNKVPKLSNHRKYMDELLTFMRGNTK